jgi:hypothetical protein
VAKKRRLLPDDAAPGEEAALKYFLRDDEKIALAWWFFCLWCADHKPAFSRQLENLAARVDRPITHVDGIQVALRFWELSMSSDPAFADQWREDREHVSEPEDWGELGGLIDELAWQEWLEWEPPEDEKRGELWGEGFKRKFGYTIEELAAATGLTVDEAAALLLRAAIVKDIKGTALAFVMWAAAAPDHKLMALADRLTLST